MTVTWTSDYNIDDAIPFVEWGLKGDLQRRSPAGTLTFDRNSMCGRIFFISLWNGYDSLFTVASTLPYHFAIHYKVLNGHWICLS